MLPLTALQSARVPNPRVHALMSGGPLYVQGSMHAIIYLLNAVSVGERGCSLAH